MCGISRNELFSVTRTFEGRLFIGTSTSEVMETAGWISSGSIVS